MYSNFISFLGIAWWRHQMETLPALLAICAGKSPVPGEFPTQRPVTRSFDVFFDLRLNKRLSKQSWGWWLETLSRPLCRHCNGDVTGNNCLREIKTLPSNPVSTMAGDVRSQNISCDSIDLRFLEYYTGSATERSKSIWRPIIISISITDI